MAHSAYKPGAHAGALALWRTSCRSRVAHPFYRRLNQILDARGFDEYVEGQCASFYATTVGRASLTPGTCFRLLLIRYFRVSIRSAGSAWRTADSLALRGFPGLGLDEAPPEHSTISRTRRLIDPGDAPRGIHLDPAGPAAAGLIKGKTGRSGAARSQPPEDGPEQGLAAPA